MVHPDRSTSSEKFSMSSIKAGTAPSEFQILNFAEFPPGQKSFNKRLPESSADKVNVHQCAQVGESTCTVGTPNSIVSNWLFVVSMFERDALTHQICLLRSHLSNGNPIKLMKRLDELREDREAERTNEN